MKKKVARLDVIEILHNFITCYRLILCMKYEYYYLLSDLHLQFW